MSLKDIILDLFGALPEPDRSPRTPTPAPPRAPAPSPAPSRPTGARSEGALLRVLQQHGAPYRKLMFSRNRRTMISVGKDRTLIRVNEAFAAADEAILAAVAALYTPGVRGRKREQAKEAVQAFINAIPVEGAPPRRPKKRVAHPADRVHVERMQREFDRVNAASFGGKLPRVPIHLSRAMRRRNGHFSSHPLEIVISWRLLVQGEEGQAEETMRHEMIHLWQYIEGLPVDHGPVFRRMAHRLDVHPRATRPVKWKPKSR